MGRGVGFAFLFLLLASQSARSSVLDRLGLERSDDSLQLRRNDKTTLFNSEVENAAVPFEPVVEQNADPAQVPDSDVKVANSNAGDEEPLGQSDTPPLDNVNVEIQADSKTVEGQVESNPDVVAVPVPEALELSAPGENANAGNVDMESYAQVSNETPVVVLEEPAEQVKVPVDVIEVEVPERVPEVKASESVPEVEHVVEPSVFVPVEEPVVKLEEPEKVDAIPTKSNDQGSVKDVVQIVDGPILMPPPHLLGIHPPKLPNLFPAWEFDKKDPSDKKNTVQVEVPKPEIEISKPETETSNPEVLSQTIVDGTVPEAPVLEEKPQVINEPVAQVAVVTEPEVLEAIEIKVPETVANPVVPALVEEISKPEVAAANPVITPVQEIQKPEAAVANPVSAPTQEISKPQVAVTVNEQIMAPVPVPAPASSSAEDSNKPFVAHMENNQAHKPQPEGIGHQVVGIAIPLAALQEGSGTPGGANVPVTVTTPDHISQQPVDASNSSPSSIFTGGQFPISIFPLNNYAAIISQHPISSVTPESAQRPVAAPFPYYLLPSMFRPSVQTPGAVDASKPDDASKPTVDSAGISKPDLNIGMNLQKPEVTVADKVTAAASETPLLSTLGSKLKPEVEPDNVKEGGNGNKRPNQKPNRPSSIGKPSKPGRKPQTSTGQLGSRPSRPTGLSNGQNKPEASIPSASSAASPEVTQETTNSKPWSSSSDLSTSSSSSSIPGKRPPGNKPISKPPQKVPEKISNRPSNNGKPGTQAKKPEANNDKPSVTVPAPQPHAASDEDKKPEKPVNTKPNKWFPKFKIPSSIKRLFPFLFRQRADIPDDHEPKPTCHSENTKALCRVTRGHPEGPDGSLKCWQVCKNQGFKHGICTEEGSCACSKDRNSHRALKIEPYVDKSHPALKSFYPVYGGCRKCACESNCEKHGWTLGFCDDTCYCGQPLEMNKPSPAKSPSPETVSNPEPESKQRANCVSGDCNESLNIRQCVGPDC